MSSHRDFELDPDEERPRRAIRPRRTDQTPLDAAWIENEALRALRRHERSRAGLERALELALHRRGERTGEAIDAALLLISSVLDGLEGRRFLDDRRYAATLYERYEAKGYARDRIRGKLAKKGFPTEVIEPLIHQSDADADRRAAWRTAKRKRLGPYCPDPERRRALRDRHLGVLARGGFSYELAIEILDAEEAPPAAYLAGDPDETSCT